MRYLPRYSIGYNLWIKVAISAAFSLAAMSIAFYFGSISPFFSRQTLPYFAIPIALVYGSAILLLPKAKSFAVASGAILCFTFFTFQYMWPPYISFLASVTNAWLSPQRLITFLAIIYALLAISISHDLKNDLIRSYRANKQILLALIVLMVTQIIAIPLAKNIDVTATATIKLFIFEYIFFIIAINSFKSEKNIQIFLFILCLCGIYLSIAAQFEVRKQGIIWTDIYPSSWIIHDDTTANILAGVLRVGEYRVITIFNTALEFAEFLAFIIPIFIFYILDNKNLLLKIVSVFGVLLCMIGIILSGSRLGIVGALAGVGVYGFLYCLRYIKKNPSSLLGPIIIVALLVGSIGFSVLLLISNRAYSAIFGNNALTQSSTQARFNQWEDGIPLILKNPIGYGYETAASTLNYRTPSGLVTIDTYWLSVTLESGIIGLIAFLTLFFYATLNTAKHYLNNTRSIDKLGATFSAIMATFLIIKLVLSQKYNHTLIFFILGIISIHFPSFKFKKNN